MFQLLSSKTTKIFSYWPLPVLRQVLPAVLKFASQVPEVARGVARNDLHFTGAAAAHHPISPPLDSLCCEFSTVSIGLIFSNLSSIQDVSKCRITFNLFAVMLQLSLFIFSIQTHLVDYVTQDFLIR